ncbi:MAG: fibrillarin-like rRNA/tRNA 2'-O-methyltransferase [Thermoplasmata archaeon]|nr:fibrillarin-like rRNA/tRNA 2'-O-methyltransferase [Thermoplasmata archaeon]
MRPLSVLPRVFEDGQRLYTLSLAPGWSVYGERRVSRRGKEYRHWSPWRSKLAAYLTLGGRFGGKRIMDEGASVLYLGAASGTTVSHISDMVPEGRIYAVEFSPRTFRGLLDVASVRDNVFPLMEDARHPERYGPVVGEADVLYQDVSQRDQIDILMSNARYLRPGGTGLLALKARSMDISLSPREIYQRAADTLIEGGFHILDHKELAPYQKDHAFFVIRKP